MRIKLQLWKRLKALGLFRVFNILLIIGLGIFLSCHRAYGFSLTSPAFKKDSSIPPLFTCNGKNISPQLNWQTPPDGTQSYALLVTDPDAPNGEWTHWLLYNIPKNSTQLVQDQNEHPLPKGTEIGKNSWNQDKYGGPCPPNGNHRYFFVLYALDQPLKLKSKDTTEQDIKFAMHGHILGTAILKGTYAG